MSNSSLVDVNVQAYSGNYSKGRSKKIECIAIHHMAGMLSAKVCGGVFQRQGRLASSHYGVGKDGEIGQYVDESDTAWTNGNWDSNCKSVTIETANCEIGGDWKISDTVLENLIKLVADIAKRNNITLVKGKTLVWHRMYAATTCPGNYLLSKFDYIIEQVNKINISNASVPQDLTKQLDFKKDTIKALQTALNNAYNARLAVDGICGTITSNSMSKILLKIGTRNELVKWVQNRLINMGYKLVGGADGLYGNYTANAVKEFQKKYGLIVDGMAGRQTITKMIEV